MHDIRCIQGKLKRDDGTVRVSDDMGASYAEVPKQCRGVSRLTFDAAWSFMRRAPGEPATSIADRAVVRQRGFSHERQERVGDEAAVNEQHASTITTDLVLDFPSLHGSTFR